MTNVLPYKQKKRVRSEYARRLISVTLSFLLVTIFFALILLLPSYVLSTSRAHTTKGQIDLIIKYVQEQGGDDSAEVLRAMNVKISALRNNSSAISFERIIDAALRHRGSHIVWGGITYEYTADGDTEEGRAVISGTANTRDSLLGFVERLESDTLFSEVDLPISNLAEERDVRFSIRLKVR